MKQWLIIMVAIFFVFAVAAESPAAYDIKLKNGNVFVTDYYRIEHGFVRFSYLNGKIGIAKDAIQAIKNSDAPVAEEIDRPRTKAPMDEAVQYKGALEKNQSEMRIQRENFRLAKKYNRKTAKDRAWRRLTGLKSERRRMREEILEIYDGTLPQWWNEILNKQQFFIQHH